VEGAVGGWAGCVDRGQGGGEFTFGRRGRCGASGEGGGAGVQQGVGVCTGLAETVGVSACRSLDQEWGLRLGLRVRIGRDWWRALMQRAVKAHASRPRCAWTAPQSMHWFKACATKRRPSPANERRPWQWAEARWQLLGRQPRAPCGEQGLARVHAGAQTRNSRPACTCGRCRYPREWCTG
jgi:hypothetical protein